MHEAADSHSNGIETIAAVGVSLDGNRLERSCCSRHRRVRGIGQAISLHLAQEEAILALNYLLEREQDAEAFLKELTGQGYHGNSTKPMCLALTRPYAWSKRSRRTSALLMC